MMTHLPCPAARAAGLHTSVAAFELPAPVAFPHLGVLDGLVSASHQAWMSGLAARVLQ